MYTIHIWKRVTKILSKYELKFFLYKQLLVLSINPKCCWYFFTLEQYYWSKIHDFFCNLVDWIQKKFKFFVSNTSTRLIEYFFVYLGNFQRIMFLNLFICTDVTKIQSPQKNTWCSNVFYKISWINTRQIYPSKDLQSSLISLEVKTNFINLHLWFSCSITSPSLYAKCPSPSSPMGATFCKREYS